MQPYHRIGLLLAGIMLIAGGWALSHRSVEAPPPAAPQPIVQDKKLEMLVAGRQLDPGMTLTVDKVEWVLAKVDSADPQIMTRMGGEDGTNPYIGRVIVQPVAKGEPILPQHFAQNDKANYVAQILQPGKRAYAIAIDTKGTVTAGNFILPNDRVDIIHSFNSANGLQSETILRNIRVLAIGQSVHSEGLSATGETATVEVDLYEARRLATAQRMGQITLALRNPNELDDEKSRGNHILIIRPAPAMEKSP